MNGLVILSNNYTYEGTIRYNEPHGYGTFTYINGHKYVGHCALGRPDGFGIYYYNNSTKYIGYFSLGKFNGIGTYENKNIISKGHWRSDKKHGNFLKTDKFECNTVRQLWIKDCLKIEESIQYIQPDSLQTSKNNPFKKQKSHQITYKTTDKKCIACNLLPMNSAVANCGHVCMCYECLNKCGGLCPICRGTIDKIIRLYIS
mgnify:CR=1 FL=1